MVDLSISYNVSPAVQIYSVPLTNLTRVFVLIVY